MILGWKLSDELMLASKMTWKDKQSSVRPFPALGIKCGIVRHRTILLLQDGVNVKLHHMMMDLVSHSFGNLNLQNAAIGFQPAVGLAESLIRGEKPQVSPGDSTHLEARLPLLHTLICCLHKLLLDVLVRRWLQVSKSVFTKNSRHLPLPAVGRRGDERRTRLNADQCEPSLFLKKAPVWYEGDVFELYQMTDQQCGNDLV